MQNPQTPSQVVQSAYVPVAIPAETAPKNPGRGQGIIGIVCAVIALFLFPPIFGIAGIILGSVSLKKGERNLGLIAIILSAVFMVIGIILGIWLNTEVEKSGSFILGPITNLL
ncbi:MAG: hypothetical protein WD231_05020 [Candidatus Woykebacteria bacterium]